MKYLLINYAFKRFSDQSIAWISSYLRNRKQVVQVESKLSEPVELDDYGVPQGSILGPLIFILFSNDFPANSNNCVSVLYADDDTVNVSASNPVDLQLKLQVAADSSTQWIADNKMVCSGEKTKLLLMGTSQLKRHRIHGQNISVTVCGKIVEASRSERLLGLTVNNQMTWSEYLYGECWRETENEKGLIAQLSQRVGLLKKVAPLMPLSRFKIVCQGLFYSKLAYCLQVIGNVWGLSNTDLVNRRYPAFTKSDNNKLQTLQNQVLRLKTGLPPLTPTVELLDKSGDLSVQQLTAFFTLSTCQKVLHTGKPKPLRDKLSVGTVSTRQENTIRIDANLTLSRGAFFYRAGMLFNKLPQELRLNMDPGTFKVRVKNWIKMNIEAKPR